MRRDRAAVVTIGIFTILTDGLSAWLLGGEQVDVRAQVESFVADEIDDIKREAAGERIEGLD